MSRRGPWFILLPLLLLGLWHVAVTRQWVMPGIIPAPAQVAESCIYGAGALFLIALGAFYPIVVNTTHGVRDTNLLLLRAARMLGAGEPTVLRKVVLPSALPSIFTGLRLGVGVAWTAVIVAEMIAVKSGLG